MAPYIKECSQSGSPLYLFHNNFPGKYVFVSVLGDRLCYADELKLLPACLCRSEPPALPDSNPVSTPTLTNVLRQFPVSMVTAGLDQSLRARKCCCFLSSPKVSYDHRGSSQLPSCNVADFLDNSDWIYVNLEIKWVFTVCTFRFVTFLSSYLEGQSVWIYLYTCAKTISVWRDYTKSMI